MPITIVQTAKNAAQQNVPANSTGTLSIAAAFGSPITAGNAIVVITEVDCNIGNNTGGGVPSTSTPHLTDTLLSTYTTATLAQGGIFIPGVAVFFTANSPGGANTITWSVKVPNGNPLFTLDQGISFIAVEVSGLGASPSVQAGNTTQQAGTGNVSISLTDSFSVSVGSDFGSRSQTSAIATDLAVSGADFFVTAITEASTAPAVTPSGYMSYVLLDTATSGAKTYLTAFYGIDAGAVTITCGSPPAGNVGVAYTHTFPRSGGTAPYTFAITAGSLPPGLTLNTSTGVVSGTPTTAGSYPFTIQVTDATAATDSVNCSISIAGTPVFLSCDNPPSGTINVPYSYGLIVTGGTPPYTFALISGALPPGLGLDASTGIISGTPVTPGLYNFGVRVTDDSSATAECTLLVLGISGPGANIYVLRDHKLTDDDFGQIYPFYVTYFSPTAEQKQQMQLGGTQNLLAYLSAFIEANSYLHLGCNLTLTFYVNMIQNPWALTVQRGLPPNATFSMECAAGSVQGEKIAVKFESSPLEGETDNAFNLQRVIFYYKQGRLPVRGSAS